MSFFIEISVVLACAFGIGCAMRILRQPLIVGYILTGIVLGPYGFQIINNGETFGLLAKMGVTILLFIVGMGLNPIVIRELGKVSIYAGITQIIITTIAGYCLGMMLGMDPIPALYLAIAFTFSSTIIILKLISDKGDTHSLYGKIAVGILLVQDVVAILVLLFVSTFQIDNVQDHLLLSVLQTLVQGSMMIVALIFVNQFLLPSVGKFIARSQELLFVFSLAWGVGLAVIFYLIGLSFEIGALIAGIMLSTTSYAYEISSRLRPLRDFFILLFFILLGSHISLMQINSLFLPALIFSVFILVGQPMIMLVIMNVLGFSRQTSFQTSMVVAQVSEFSLILATIGLQLGHLSQQTVSLITLVGLITIIISSYFILYSEQIYPFIERILAFFEIRKNINKRHHAREIEALLLGCRPGSEHIIKLYQKLGLHFLVLDFDPAVIKHLDTQGIPCRYADVNDMDGLSDIQFEKLKYCIITLKNPLTNQYLAGTIRKRNKKVIIITKALDVDAALSLYTAGANYVLVENDINAHHIARIIESRGTHVGYYHELRSKYLEKYGIENRS